MRFVIALFATFLIAAACGKKVQPRITTEMDVAILRDDGGIYANQSNRRHSADPLDRASRARTSVSEVKNADAQYDFSIQLRETRIKTRIESEIAIDLFESGSEEQLLGRLVFKLAGKPISEYGSFRETCSLAGDPQAFGTCRIQSVILTKEEVDALGNRNRLFKHRSENYARDHAGIRTCELQFESHGIDWRTASYVEADGRISEDESYRYALITSVDASQPHAETQLTVTCFQDRGASDSKGHRSVFRGVFKQSAKF